VTLKWTFGVGVGASWPTEAHKVDHSLSLGFNGGYSLADRLSAELAYVKEFAASGPDTGYRWRWVNGDQVIGIGASYRLGESARHSLDVSVGVERNFTASEHSVHLDLAYGFSF
jgi:hypothetical protein